MPWDLAKRASFDDDVWELYNLTEDFSESNDLANEHPEKLKELIAEWDNEAFKYGAYPLYDDVVARLNEVNKRYAPQRKTFDFYPSGAVRIPEAYAPPAKNSNHTITGELDLPSDGTSGVIVAQCGLYSGYALYLVDGELRYKYNAFNENRYNIRSSKKVPTGDTDQWHSAIFEGTKPIEAEGQQGPLIQSFRQSWQRSDSASYTNWLR